VTPPSRVPHPGDYCAFEIAAIGAPMPAVVVFVLITITVAVARGGTSSDFSGGNYRRCDRRPTSILDLSSLF